jgi:hypothetical protein
MPSLAATLAAAAPLVLAGERSLFHLPSPDEVRMQPVERTDNEAGWPFSVDSGHLSCVWSAGQRLVFFFAETPGEGGEGEPRGVILSMDPVQLTLMNVANRDLFAPSADVAERIRQVAPFHALGQRLCDQPPGAQVGHGEL